MTETSAPFWIVFVLYGVVTIGAALLVLNGEWRDRISQNISIMHNNAGHALARLAIQFGTGLVAAMRDIGRNFLSCTLFLRRYRWPSTAAVCLLVAPMVFSMLMQRHLGFDGFAETHQTDPIVEALLQGEQLSPPPPLPPEIFATPEIAQSLPEIAGASREWLLLDADFRKRLLVLFQLMEQRGYPMALLEGYRSPERQTFLAARGPQTTNAAAWQSYHQYGLASDGAFLRDGKLVISETDAWALQGYRLYGELAESLGLAWGGRWKMRDLGHVELQRRSALLAQP